MNPNADYLGIVTMLRSLREQGLVSGSEAKNRRAAEGTAWRGHHYFSLISSLLG